MNHLVESDFAKNSKSSETVKTYQNILIVVEFSKRMPSEVLEAIGGIQSTAASRADSGLASIMVGLVSGKSMMKQARAFAEEATKEVEWLTPITDLSHELGTFELPSTCTDFSELAEKINQGVGQLVDVYEAKQSNSDACRPIIMCSKKAISDFAGSVCKLYIKSAFNEWIAELNATWVGDLMTPSVPDSHLWLGKQKYAAVLNTSANELIHLALDMEAMFRPVYQCACKAKKNELDAAMVIQVVEDFEAYLSANLGRLKALDLIHPSMESNFKECKTTLVAMADARINVAASEQIAVIGDMVAKARRVQ